MSSLSSNVSSTATHELKGHRSTPPNCAIADRMKPQFTKFRGTLHGHGDNVRYHKFTSLLTLLVCPRQILQKPKYIRHYNLPQSSKPPNVQPQVRAKMQHFPSQIPIDSYAPHCTATCHTGKREAPSPIEIREPKLQCHRPGRAQNDAIPRTLTH